MSTSPRSLAGFSLVELLIVLVLIGILATRAAPSFEGAIASIRARAALGRLSAEIYRARMLAVESGFPVHMILHTDADGCAHEATLVRTRPPAPAVELPSIGFDLAGLCLRHTGSATLVFDARGMLRPPARSFSIVYGSTSHQVIVSIAGRIRRTY